MAIGEKTVRFAFDPRLTTLATATTLAGAAEHDFGDITIQLPESSKTFRSVIIRLTHMMCTTTTARRLDGVRCTCQIDAVTPAASDLTGTGLAQSGDPYSHSIDFDATTHFVNNYVGTSHTLGVLCRYEHDVIDVVQQITCEVFITYSYEGTSARQIKTVSFPLEGLTTFAGTVANTNIRGTSATGQIPLLNTYLPEANKTYRQIWLEVSALDGSAAVTDFSISYSISGSTTAVRSLIEGGLNGSTRWYDLWNITAIVNPAAVQDFQAWSSLASRFEGLHAIIHITYECDLPTGRVMNSIRIPIRSDIGMVMGTVAGDRAVYESEFVIAEPGTITIKQSGAQVFYGLTSSVNLVMMFEGTGKATGAQTTARTYVGNSMGVHAGSRVVAHRLDLAHGGTALSFARGKNIIRMLVYSSSATNAILDMNGWFYINYESDVSASGIQAHNNTLVYYIGGGFNMGIAGAVNLEIATANQRTPILTPANYFLSAVGYEFNIFASVRNYLCLYAEILAGESSKADGWAVMSKLGTHGPTEIGWITNICPDENDYFRKYPNDIYRQNIKLNIETARKYRFSGLTTLHTSLRLVITVHAIPYTVAGDITGSSGGTVNISLISADDNRVLDKTSRVGNGSYSFTWYDPTEQVYTEARESGLLLGRSETATPV